jgi:hypothetical protein
MIQRRIGAEERIMARERDIAENFIDDADEEGLAWILACAIDRLGEFGRSGAEALLKHLQTASLANAEEGLAQLEAVEGVISGRTDSL